MQYLASRVFISRCRLRHREDPMLESLGVFSASLRHPIDGIAEIRWSTAVLEGSECKKLSVSCHVYSFNPHDE